VGFVLLHNINDDQLIRNNNNFVTIKFRLNENVESHRMQLELKSNSLE
jgi:hypothetical protein